jgi:plastocyanin
MSRRTVRVRVLVLPLAVALTLVAGAARAGVDAVIRNSGTTWDPTRTVVREGDTVKWKVVSGLHTVTSYGGGWSKDVELSAGESTRKTFNSAGLYKFRCRFHSTLDDGVCSGMCGRVRVRG